MTRSEARTHSLRLVERPTSLSVNQWQSDSPACCPHYRLHDTGTGLIPVCDALPILAPIAQARTRSRCLSPSFDGCPQFQYVAKSVERARAKETPKGVAIDWTLVTLRESGWVVGIPLTLVIVIIIALLLTQ